MKLIRRYLALIALSIALPFFTVFPTLEYGGSIIAHLARIAYIPIYACLAVFLMTTMRPANMRRYLESSKTPIDDIHLWLAPIMVLCAFLWAGMILVSVLAVSGFHNTFPIIFLFVFLSIFGLSIWIAIRVRKAFFKEQP